MNAELAWDALETALGPYVLLTTFSGQNHGFRWRNTLSENTTIQYMRHYHIKTVTVKTTVSQ